MVAELTAEEVVTKLLTTQEILARKSCEFITNPNINLGEYLASLPAENIESTTSSSVVDSKFLFIRGKWKG